MRGSRSAGYGFVALASAEAAEKAVAALDKTELDGRQIIVEVAKAPEQKDKERKEKKTTKNRRQAGRRGDKAVPGEVTEAEAAGEPAAKAEGGEAAEKPKKKKKKTVVRFFVMIPLPRSSSGVISRCLVSDPLHFFYMSRT